jgi:MoaA/NifB/PqqE/SkfB family radical SAM enzyme
MRKKAVLANLTDIFEDAIHNESHVGKRLITTMNETSYELTPPFPKQIQIETSNICNHSCNFCAYSIMGRKKGLMDKDLFGRVVREAYGCGAREIGLFAGAEPLTCKWLDEAIRLCVEVGYEYTYISTNGALGGQKKFQKILDAGLNSIKFSVNAGTRKSYEVVHGRDDFEKVIENIKFVANYRSEVPQAVYLGVSFVGTEITSPEFSDLRELLDKIVDEMIFYEASNQSGQMPDLPAPPYRDCHLPFNKAHISREGYLKVCCNDYENLLAIEDINRMSLIEAWHSPRFQELRQRHLDSRMDVEGSDSKALDGTVCANCIRSSTCKAEPINPELMPLYFKD